MADPGASPPLATCRRMLPLKMFSLSLLLAGGEALAAQDCPPILLPQAYELRLNTSPLRARQKMTKVCQRRLRWTLAVCACQRQRVPPC